MKSLCGDLILQRLGQADGTATARPMLARMLYSCIREAIHEGLLAPATRLPASRDLALEVHVGRNTVTRAYEQLLAEGYVKAITGSGTYVADISTLQKPRGAQEFPASELPLRRHLSDRGTALLQHAQASGTQWGAFMPGLPDVTQIPDRKLTQLISKHLSSKRVELMTYGVEGGHSSLRQALAGYISQVRSVKCQPEQILITEGVHHALDLTVRLLTDAGDTVWQEEPGYWGIKGVLSVNGVKSIPATIDREGLQFPTKPYEQAPKLIFVTPSHQYPLGTVMSLNRRLSLLEFAQRRGAWIVEDDYDSEFRFSERPISSLQGLSPENVIYVGTFSKTLYPGLRLAYLILPDVLIANFRKAQSELYREGRQEMQAALADFISAGHYASHVRKMRLLYGTRRDILVSLIDKWLGPEWLHPFDSPAGLHLVIRFPTPIDDVKVTEAARRRGIAVRPLSAYYSAGSPLQGLVLGFAATPEARIASAFALLVESIRETAQSTRSAQAGA